MVVRRDRQGKARALIGYVEIRAGSEGLLPRHILAMLAQVLPGHMVPASIVPIPALPRFPNFKIDRPALAAMDADPAARQAERASDPVLDRVAAVFERVIGVSGASSEDNMLSLGGDSLGAVDVVLELEREFGVRVPVDAFRDRQSLRDLADWVRGMTASPRRGDGSRRAARSARPDIASVTDALISAVTEGRAPEVAAAPELLVLAGKAAIERAPIEVSEAVVRLIHQLHPAIPWAARVCALFDRMPPARSGDPTFYDDRTTDLQTVPRPGAGTVVFAFSGKGRGLGMPLPMMHRWLGRLDASVVYLRDLQGRHYLSGVSSLGGDREQTLAALRRMAADLGAGRILCYGNSSGGFAAIDYGLALGAEAVLTTSGSTNIAPEFNGHLRYVRTAGRLRADFPEAALDLRETYLAAERRPRTLLAYAEHNWDDRLQAEHMAGLPDVSLHMVAGFDGHNTAAELARSGRFEALLDALQAPAAPA